MRKILKALYILQGRTDKNRFTKYRLNPFNPLSYVTIILTVTVAILLFGFIGAWKEIDLQNPFKWN